MKNLIYNFCPDRLRETRQIVGLSMEKVAERIGVSLASYRKYETGKMKPGFNAIWLLAEYFGVALDYLTGRTDEKFDADLYSTSFATLRGEAYERYLVSSPRLVDDTITPAYPYNLVNLLSNKPYSQPFSSDQYEGLEFALSQLSDKERECVIMYFQNEWTYEKIGHKFGVTRERIRQIVSKSVRKLRPYIDYIIEGKEGYKIKQKINTLEYKLAYLERLEKEYKDVSDRCVRPFAPISDLCLSMRSYTALTRAGVENIDDLIKLINNNRLESVRNLGRKSIDEVKEKTKQYLISIKEEKDVVDFLLSA